MELYQRRGKGKLWKTTHGIQNWLGDYDCFCIHSCLLLDPSDWWFWYKNPWSATRIWTWHFWQFIESFPLALQRSSAHLWCSRNFIMQIGQRGKTYTVYVILFKKFLLCDNYWYIDGLVGFAGQTIFSPFVHNPKHLSPLPWTWWK